MTPATNIILSRNVYKNKNEMRAPPLFANSSHRLFGFLFSYNISRLRAVILFECQVLWYLALSFLESLAKNHEIDLWTKNKISNYFCMKTDEPN